MDDFYAAMQVSEGEHLKAFCGFIKSNLLDGALRNHQWAKLAAGYGLHTRTTRTMRNWRPPREILEAVALATR